MLLALERECRHVRALQVAFPWVLKTYVYNDVEELLDSLKKYKVIAPAEGRARELRESEVQ